MLSHNEQARLAKLNDLSGRIRGQMPAFQPIADRAKACFNVPIAQVSVIDATDQIYLGNCGISATSAPRDQTFCTYTIATPGLVVVEDTLIDDRFKAHPFLRGAPHLRFYAGAPITWPGELKLGTVCLADVRPRRFRPAPAPATSASPAAVATTSSLGLRIVLPGRWRRHGRSRHELARSQHALGWRRGRRAHREPGRRKHDPGGAGSDLIILKESNSLFTDGGSSSFGHQVIDGGSGTDTLRFVINDQSDPAKQAFVTEFMKVEAAFDFGKAHHLASFSVAGLEVSHVERIELEIDSVSKDPATPYLVSHLMAEADGVPAPHESSTLQHLLPNVEQ